MDEKLAGEAALRASGMPYTIVRPGVLIDIDIETNASKAKLTHSALPGPEHIFITIDILLTSHTKSISQTLHGAWIDWLVGSV